MIEERRPANVHAKPRLTLRPQPAAATRLLTAYEVIRFGAYRDAGVDAYKNLTLLPTFLTSLVKALIAS
jgi:hypothetical protein